MSLFPELDGREVLAASRQRWDLSGPLPVPKGDWMHCGTCGHDVIQARFWRYHERSGLPTVAHRCDVSVKCCSCAAVWIHGVALDENTFTRTARKIGRKIHWREARQLLEAHDADDA